MTTYLVKIKPLENYAFGTDVKLPYPDPNEDNRKSSYITKSNLIPEQTTILGMLRYQLLDYNHLLHSNFIYTKEEKESMDQLIGKDSFQFSKSNQKFGKIISISPVFLIKDCDSKTDIYVRNPLHNAVDEGDHHSFIRMDERMNTSFGSITLPKIDSKTFDSRNKYINISDVDDNVLVNEDDLFTRSYQIGINKNNKDENDDKGFFKQEVVRLNDKFCFGVYLELDDDGIELEKKSVCHMGQKQSMFSIEFIEDENNLLEKIVKKFKNEQQCWYYALSDIVITEEMNYSEFCMINKKSIRNLETVIDNKQLRTKRTKKQYNLIQSGSVFYLKNPFDSKKNENCIGYNQLVRIGGN